MADINGVRHLVITIHGIQTYGRWQERLKALLNVDGRWRSGQSENQVVSYKFGVFTIASFCIAWFRHRAADQFRLYLDSLFETGGNQRVDIIAHSFGTYLALEALASRKLSREVRIHTAIFCGSVISPNRDLSHIVGPGRVIGRLINECRIFDRILPLALLPGGLGMAGRIGLQGLEGYAIWNRYHRLGHSGYFMRRRHLPYDGFMCRWWVPLLLTERSVVDRDRRPETPPFSDMILRLMGENGAKVTIAFYLASLTCVAVPFSIGVNALQRAEEQRQAKLIATSQHFAAVSREHAVNHEYADAIRSA
ncbi:MAG: hypothetical protein ACREF3_10880, partial [Acetobacteraceae bacterium]